MTISAIGLGGGSWGREIDEEASYRIMDYAVEKGITFFDTGDTYGGGQSREGRKVRYGVSDEREVTGEMYSSEKIIGRWMRSRGCRDEITLCTKVDTGGDPENIANALAGSLDRLGVDRVDIYKLHSPDASVPIAETMVAMSEEVDAGRTSVIGCSNQTAEQLRQSLEASKKHGLARWEIIQPSYSLAAPEDERDVFPLCQEEQVAISSYSPLAAGFLTGKYGRDPLTWPAGSRYHISPAHADVYFSDLNFRLLDLLKEKAAQMGTPSLRLAMAWAMTHPAVTSVIIGTRTTNHIDNALAAMEMDLDPALREEMSSWTRED
jgi:aryl-alcohol dehydrogenase-like predicted oxidoreductase